MPPRGGPRPPAANNARRGRSPNLFQSYFSIVLARTPFGTIRLTRHFSAWTGLLSLIFAVASFLVYWYTGKRTLSLDRLDDWVYDWWSGGSTSTGSGPATTRSSAGKTTTATSSTGLPDITEPPPLSALLPAAGAKDEYIYDIEVVAVYPHDPKSFTQGLLVMPEGDDSATTTTVVERDLLQPLFAESVGLYGESRVFQYRLAAESKQNGDETEGVMNAPPLAEYKQSRSEFGEGLAFHKGYFWQLVWKQRVLHQYSQDLKTRIATVAITGFEFDDGWGLTSDADYLYATDSGNKLYTLKIEFEGTKMKTDMDKSTTTYTTPVAVAASSVRVTNSVAVRAKYNRRIEMLNELERIGLGREKEVWGNIFGSECVARVDPTSGKVKGFILAHSLRMNYDVGRSADVLNGIAVTTLKNKRSTSAPDAVRLFLTGKLWNKIFEVRLKPFAGQLDWKQIRTMCVPEKNLFHK
ncbi:unnamed protein product [Amoebophrya sp. A25]|nr:unnamed protein product [Amoebophrya sp. A25]|eukprot:GSA25T00021379001.1